MVKILQLPTEMKDLMELSYDASLKKIFGITLLGDFGM